MFPSPAGRGQGEGGLYYPITPKWPSTQTSGVFGFYVRGEQKPQSDLDVWVEFDKHPSRSYRSLRLSSTSVASSRSRWTYRSRL